MADGVVERRLDPRQSREVEHRVSPAQRREPAVGSRDIELDEVGRGVDVRLVAGREVVEHGDPPPVGEQQVDDVRADEARSPRYHRAPAHASAAATSRASRIESGIPLYLKLPSLPIEKKRSGKSSV